MRTPLHHGSHRRLLWTPDESATKEARVDAIVVPTARPPAYLQEAAGIALALNCPLVTLHSRKWTSPQKTVAYLSHWLGRIEFQSLDLIAIDVTELANLRLPVFETSRLLDGTIFSRRVDISHKRNLGLMLSHMLGWERVVFLDDDIQIPNSRHLCQASGMLDTHSAVGLAIGGYPDNSVVCHAFRLVGGDQECFIGGGALAVQVKRNSSFFPDVYNDDWFYMLDAGKRLQPVATAGRVIQAPYDPFRTPDRARQEELGDVLAEGAFWLLDQGKSVADGDVAHWGDFLLRRRGFIEHVLEMVMEAAIEPAEQARMVEALKASLGRLACITPELCLDYLRAWAVDQERWQRHIRSLPRLPRERALRSLSRKGSTPLEWYIGSGKTLAPGRPGSTRVPHLRPGLSG
jgi:hypothetical protein